MGVAKACLASVIVITLALVGSGPAAAEKLRVGKAVAEAFSFAPLDIGVRKGIFARHGLDIESVAFTGDARMQQAMAADSIDIALGSGPAMAFIVKGSPIKAVAAMAGAPLLMAIVVRPDGPRSVAELRGKNLVEMSGNNREGGVPNNTKHPIRILIVGNRSFFSMRERTPAVLYPKRDANSRWDNPQRRRYDRR